jgi:hypothetical protein
MTRMTRRGPARFWLLVAAVLAASAAFGIHPEPPSAMPDGALEISTTAPVEGPGVPHDCLACRAHRPLVSAPAPLVIASPERSAIRRALPRSIALRSVPLPPSVGRAPPVSA